MLVVVMCGTAIKCYHPVFGFLPIWLFVVVVLVPILEGAPVILITTLMRHNNERLSVVFV